MKTIWKALAPTDADEILLPKGAEIICAREQGETVCIWFVCDPNAPKEDVRVIRVYGTGHTMPDNPGRYLGTAILHNGQLVLHVFEATTDKVNERTEDEMLQTLLRQKSA